MSTPAAPAPKAQKKAKPVRPSKKPAKGKGSQPAQSAPRRAPILLELVYTVLVLVVIGVGLSAAILSWMAGADLLMIVVRAGGACLVTGLLAWIIYWLIANGVVEARRQQVLEEAAKQKAARMAQAAPADKAESTMEFEA
jgi:hypothetical protein